MKTKFPFKKIFSPPIAVLVIHFFILFIGVYNVYPDVDIPAHFMGGFSAAWSFVLLFKFAYEEKLIGEMNPLVFFVFVVSLVSLTAVLWEFFEFGLDTFFNLHTQLSLRDTMGDLFFGLVGGVCGFLYIYPKALR